MIICFKYWKIFRNYIGSKIYIAVVLSIVSTCFESLGIMLFLPILESMEDKNISSQSTGIIHKFSKFLNFELNNYSLLLFVFTVLLIKSIILFNVIRINAKNKALIIEKSRNKVNKTINNYSYQRFIKQDVGYFSSVVTLQCTKMGMSYFSLVSVVNMFFSFALYFCFTLYVSISVALIGMSTGVVFYFLIKLIERNLRNESNKNIKNEEAYLKCFNEKIDGYFYLKSTNRLDLFENNLLDKSKSIRNNQSLIGFFEAISQSAKEPIALFAILSIVFINYFFIGTTISTVLIGIVFFYKSLINLLGIQSSYQSAIVNFTATDLISSRFHFVEYNKNSSFITCGKIENIEFRDVSFSYDNLVNQVTGLNLLINNNDLIVISGESGSGKSTLAKLLTLILEPTKGELLINGTDSHLISKDSYREQIGYVAQDPVVINDSIINNLLLGNDSISQSDNTFINICKSCMIDKFIDEKEDGFDFICGDRGGRLSGGQRQRIAIARELLRSPQLLILDEITSSLDKVNSREVFSTINNLYKKLPIIFITHEPDSVIRYSKKITFKK